jgi:hypothetical protein
MKSRIVLYCVFGGLAMSIVALGIGHFFWWGLSGVVMAASFVPIALFGPRRLAGQLGVVLPVLFIVTVLCTWSEAVFFFPSPEMRQRAMSDLQGELITYLIVGTALAVLAVALKLGRDSAYSVKMRPPSSLVMMALVAGLVYLCFYLVTGGITYQFFTKQYYPDAPQIAMRIGAWFWVMQFGRGLLMALAVLPAICTLRMSRMNSAIAIGLLVWVAGGLALLIPPNQLLGPTQRFIHTIEILTQNFPLGFATTLLMQPKATAASNAGAMPAAQAHT